VWLCSAAVILAARSAFFLLGCTDVIDGMVARGARETSAFGMFLDPMADILSTSAVYHRVVVDGSHPALALCCSLLRYLPLAIVALVLTRTSGPVDFRSTVPGKIVGVVQGRRALWIMAWAAAGMRPCPGTARYLLSWLLDLCL
jgi:phosphatidylglycerophosphate synthase